MGKPFVDRVGERYGRLVITNYIGISNKAGKYRLWQCHCDCGNSCIVSYRELSRGHTQSCGCLFRETLKKRRGWNKKREGESAFNQLFYNYQKSAKHRKYNFELTEDEFRLLVESPCYYCGSYRTTKAARAKGTNGDYFYTGIDRIDNTKGYTVDNSRPCCKQCNIAKGVLSESDFINWVRCVCLNLQGKINVYQGN